MQRVFEVMEKVAADRRHRADHRRDRHRQGAGRARDPRRGPAQGARASSPRTAARCPRRCSRASSSATSAAPSPAPTPTRRACSRSPTAARSSSTRSARPTPGHAGAAAARAPGRRDPPGRRGGHAQGRRAHHRRHQPRPAQGGGGGALPRGSLLPAERGRDRRCRRCASAARTSRCWPTTSSTSPTRRWAAQLKGFTNAAMDRLVAHDWPGNVRELENEIERAVALAGDADTITAEMLSEHIRGATRRAADPADRRSAAGAGPQPRRRRAQAPHDPARPSRETGSKTRAAERLGIPRQSLQKMMKRLGDSTDDADVEPGQLGLGGALPAAASQSHAVRTMVVEVRVVRAASRSRGGSGEASATSSGGSPGRRGASRTGTGRPDDPLHGGRAPRGWCGRAPVPRLQAPPAPPSEQRLERAHVGVGQVASRGRSRGCRCRRGVG